MANQAKKMDIWQLQVILPGYLPHKYLQINHLRKAYPTGKLYIGNFNMIVFFLRATLSRIMGYIYEKTKNKWLITNS